MEAASTAELPPPPAKHFKHNLQPAHSLNLHLGQHNIMQTAT